MQCAYNLHVPLYACIISKVMRYNIQLYNMTHKLMFNIIQHNENTRMKQSVIQCTTDII